MKDRIDERNKKFQDTQDLEKHRRNRENFAVELRKQKRSHYSQKRRITVQEQAGQEFGMEPDWVPKELVRIDARLIDPGYLPLQRLNILLALVNSKENPRTIQAGVTLLKEVLTKNETFPYTKLVNSPVPEILLSMLPSPDKELTTNLLYCIANICGGPGELVELVYQLQGLNLLIQLYSQLEDPLCQELCVWALTNIAADKKEYCQEIHSNRFPHQVANRLMDPRLSVSYLTTMIWHLSEVFRQLDPSDLMADLYVLLPRFLSLENSLVLQYTLWLVHHITLSGTRVSYLIESGLIYRILGLLGTSYDLAEPGMKIIGNIAMGSNDFVGVILNAGVLEKLSLLMSPSAKPLLREGLFTLSNIAADAHHAELVLNNPCFNIVLESLKDGDYNIRFEAIHVIKNITQLVSLANLFSIHTLLIPAVTEFLRTNDSNLLEVGLIAIETLLVKLRQFELENDCEEDFALKRLDEVDGIVLIEGLQRHANEEVFKISTRIVEKCIGTAQSERPEYFEFT